jgi:serine protease Do
VLTIPEIASKVGPSVVGVINKTVVQPQKYYDPFSGRYYYYQDPSADSNNVVEQGSGSGIIISEDGYIVTNQHVIDGASEISVILNTGDEITATLVGQDTKTDLAVLKVDTDIQLTAATLGDSTQLQVGELAVAIGNPMGQEFSGSVTAGIVSAVNRTMTIDDRTYNLIQTDAAINAGNSGGALINQYGEVVGINSVKLSSTGVEGMGFAIAISEAKPIIEDLQSSGYVTGRPLVGIGIQETKYGLFIGSVAEGTGAEEAGLKVGDMIIEVDGQKVSSSSDINTIRDTKKPGDYLTFKILRDGETSEVQVRLTENSSSD